MAAAMESDEAWERSGPALRFLHLWAPFVSNATVEKFFDSILPNLTGVADVSTYYDRILHFFRDRPNIIAKVHHVLLEEVALLGPLSFVPFDEIDPQLRNPIAERTILSDSPWRTDRVVPVKHVDCYAGSCSKMQGHWDALASPDARPWARGHGAAGNLVLVYVRGSLIGTMKMNNDRSVLGLRNVRDSTGKYPVVIGGVYATSSEIVAAAEAAFEARGEGWAKLDIDTIPLRPVALIGHRHDVATSREMLAALVRIRERLERPQL